MAKNRLPTNVKRLRGTYRKHRERKNGPLERSVPKRPQGMTEGGKKYWRMLVERLSRLGILTEIDDLCVMVAAESLSTFMRNSKILEEKGETYKFTNAKGEVSIKVRPELKIMNDAWIRVFALFKQYGLTHLSRGSISPLPDSEERNPWANLNRRVK